MNLPPFLEVEPSPPVPLLVPPPVGGLFHVVTATGGRRGEGRRLRRHLLVLFRASCSRPSVPAQICSSWQKLLEEERSEDEGGGGDRRQTGWLRTHSDANSPRTSAGRPPGGPGPGPGGPGDEDDVLTFVCLQVVTYSGPVMKTGGPPWCRVLPWT